MASEKGESTGTEGEPATAGVPLKVLVDLNVVLDVLQARKPHYETSARIWAAVEEGRLDGSVAAHSVTTLFYLLNRHLSAAEAISAIHDLVAVFSVAKVDDGVIRNALSYGWRDFEDAVQMAAAVGVGADFVVTRNPKDFKAGPVAVLEPASLHAILQAP